MVGETLPITRGFETVSFAVTNHTPYMETV
jgi:hypothetical protein